MKSIDPEALSGAKEENTPPETITCLTFSMAGEAYGLDIGKVREIIDWGPVTRVPRMPGCILGVINLRGGVVTVIDLMKKLELGDTKRNEESCLIVSEAVIAGETALVGIAADAVLDVVRLKAEDMASSTKTNKNTASRYVTRMARVGRGGVILMLDMDPVFAEESDDAQHTEQTEPDATTDMECIAETPARTENGASTAEPFPA